MWLKNNDDSWNNNSKFYISQLSLGIEKHFIITLQVNRHLLLQLLEKAHLFLAIPGEHSLSKPLPVCCNKYERNLLQWNKAGYTALDAPSSCITPFSAIFPKVLRTNGPTDRRTDWPTNGWTHPLIEMQGCI